MMNITFSADQQLIERARERARSEHTTLNEAFRHWLTAYAGNQQRAHRAMQTIQVLQQRIQTEGRRFTRDELNER